MKHMNGLLLADAAVLIKVSQADAVICTYRREII